MYGWNSRMQIFKLSHRSDDLYVPGTNDDVLHVLP
jgi:hypothetical protein